MSDRPKVAFINTGGTMNIIGRDRTDLTQYVQRGTFLDRGELLALVPELTHIADVEEVDFRRLRGSTLTDRDWLDLARLIDEIAVRSDGVVVCHGTNALEETAYFLNLALKTTAAVVIVGSIRPARSLGSDAELNLLRAVQVAAAPQSRRKGVLIVMNDAILAARDATKRQTSRVDSFIATDTGPLGFADSDGEVVYYHSHLRRHTADSALSVDGLQELAPVQVVVSHVGADGSMIRAAVAAGVRGIVVAGSGAGTFTLSETRALDEATEAGVVVCVCSRVGAGRVPRAAASANPRWITADNLQPWKARVLLSLALTEIESPEQLQIVFDTH